MHSFKKTIYFKEIIESPYGPKFAYDYIYADSSHEPGTGHTSLNYSADLFKDKKYVPKEKDKLYFLPGCNIPRFKLKEFCEKHKIAPVKYRVRANVVIVGPDSYRELFTTKHDSVISFDTFTKWIDSMSSAGDIRFLQLKNDLRTVNENFNFVVVNRALFIHITTKATRFNLVINAPKGEHYPVGQHDSFNMLKDEESLNVLNDMSDPNGNFYNQNDILSELNTGMVLNEENYLNIRNLFLSSDTENMKLAMECMSNSDFRQSAVSILLLLKEFGAKIYATKNKDHVNFKALLKYFGITYVSSVSIDTIIDSLIAKDLLTQKALNLFLPEVEETMTTRLGYKHFHVKKIEYSQAILDALAKEHPVVIEESVSDLITVQDVNNIVYLGHPVVVEVTETGEPLMSVQSVIMDMSGSFDDSLLLGPPLRTDEDFNL